jgi:ribosomal peptide maturation radical SAM protein 1
MNFTELKGVTKGGDVLIVVPPFTDSEAPTIGAHMVQAAALEKGFAVNILYASLLLAAKIGESVYTAIGQAASGLMGERFFAAAAYDVPLLGHTPIDDNPGFQQLVESFGDALTPREFGKLASDVTLWIEELVNAIVQLDFPIVGCSSMFQQTAASIAILRRVKQRRPETITILGGANCEGEMAEGILTLDAGVDYVFSGESEDTFGEFLSAWRSGRLLTPGIVHGKPCRDVNNLPIPKYDEYYEQRKVFLADGETARRDEIWLPYESSRGCWWGQKHHCTFCGISDQTLTFRAKTPARVIEDLKTLMSKHPTRKLGVVDWIMPQNYFRDLLPLLETEVPNLDTYYLVKANLSLANVVALKKAGASIMQPGIEALSTSLLKRVKKGVSASQNITLLRYGRSVDLAVAWLIIHGFPGDQLGEYEETLKLLPLLRHLHPPLGAIPMGIHRFSPYFDRPEEYGISNVRPTEAYLAVLPRHADARKIAFHFEGDYRSAARENPEVIERITEQVQSWRLAWKKDSERPSLAVSRLFADQFLLMDTRGLPGTQEIHFLSREQAAIVLAGTNRRNLVHVDWALENKLAVELDSRIVPLATADAEIIREFESEANIARRRSLPIVNETAEASKENQFSPHEDYVLA